MTKLKIHPCQNCGACCASYKVSFHWSETLEESYAVPVEWAENTSLHQMNMRGTNDVNPHCAALRGDVGRSVQCVIYKNRPSCCRQFEASFENGKHEIRCDEARAKKGFSPLNMQTWSHQ